MPCLGSRVICRYSWLLFLLKRPPYEYRYISQKQPILSPLTTVCSRYMKFTLFSYCSFTFSKQAFCSLFDPQCSEVMPETILPLPTDTGSAAAAVHNARWSANLKRLKISPSMLTFPSLLYKFLLWFGRECYPHTFS